MSFCLSHLQCVCPHDVKREYFTDLKRFGVHIFIKSDHILLRDSKPFASASRDESKYLLLLRDLFAILRHSELSHSF